MRTINRYISKSFLTTFFPTLLVFVFMMCIGVVFKMTDILTQGVPWRPVFYIFLCEVPSALTFVIPISVLTTSLLVFGRLSSDNEITAMRACGISLWQIISRPALLSLLMTTICLYINNELAPNSHYIRRTAIAELSMISPVKLMETGRFIQDFAGLTIYIGKKKGNLLHNIRIYDIREHGVKREIRAKYGRVEQSTNKTDLVMDLHDVRIDPRPGFSNKPGSATIGRYRINIPNALTKHKYKKTVADMDFYEQIRGIQNVETNFSMLNDEDKARQKMSIAVDLNERIILSILCFCFVLLGVPLGIKTHRKESSIGVAISLFLVFNSYLFIVIADSLVDCPKMRPDLIVWLPVLISVSLGLYLIHRAN